MSKFNDPGIPDPLTVSPGGTPPLFKKDPGDPPPMCDPGDLPVVH